MPLDEPAYAGQLRTWEPGLLTFLRTVESIQENFKLHEVKARQAELVGATGDLFRRFNAEFAPISPPAIRAQFHNDFVVAVAHLERSMNLFMTPSSPEWTVVFLRSRHSFVRGLYALYELRGQLPELAEHFTIAGVKPVADEPPPQPSAVPIGFSHIDRNADRGRYSLYVPENYSDARKWPLIICLHGGYGDGFDYIWTWLRPARTDGYILLSPKSLAETWTMTMNSVDTRSIMRMLDDVKARYSIDEARVFLTGLSDGGIFTYIMGLERHEIFTGLAPVAGALHMAADPMLRTKTGVEVPIFVVHGYHDFIFPVTFTRQTNELLRSLDYNIKYEELSEWGHAFPYSINETLVGPWFQSLPSRTS